MWDRKLTRKLLLNNKGTFTVEAVFIMLIITGVILAMLYVIMYSFDRINLECTLRDDVHNNIQKQSYEGQLGNGILQPKNKLDFLNSDYILDYKISFVFPLTNEYIQNQFLRMYIRVRTCKNNAADTVRYFDAIKNKE